MKCVTFGTDLASVCVCVSSSDLIRERGEK